ncbi:MAG: uncharacterized protein V7641_4101 [Blastocatellia bacterium]
MDEAVNRSSRLRRIVFDLWLGAFLISLFLIIWLPPGDAASVLDTSPAANGSPGNVLPMQGTSILVTLNGSISTSDPTFTGQRHFRSNTLGDRICQPFGVTGARHYDQYFFVNTSPLPQQISVGFHSNCGFNTYTAAFSPQFDPNDICANYLASAGNSGDVNWSFMVCGNSQFSIVVYGLEPGVTCSGYQLAVGGTSAIVFSGPPANSPSQPPVDGEIGPFTRTDITPKQLRRGNRARAGRTLNAPPPAFASPATVLPLQATPLVASITDSIDFTEPTFNGPRHLGSAIIGSPNCSTFPPIGTRYYDEYFFMNNSPMNQKVFVSFTTGCGLGGIFMAAFSPQFNPNDICANYIGGVNGYQTVNWEFTVCPNTRFSIVVYNERLDQRCAGYFYQVFGNDISFIGTLTDMAVVKTGPSGPVAAGSDVTYQITVSNNGPQRADQILLTDALPHGTTFLFLNLLTSISPAFTPVCTTPPVGGTGTVNCSMSLPAVPGTGIPTSLQFALGVHVTTLAGVTLSNTATVSHQGIDPNPANNTSTTTAGVSGGFDLCLQDEANGSILRFNSITGAYQFINCKKGIALAGTGQVKRAGCKTDFLATGPDPKRPDRNITASVNTCTQQGSATIKLLASGLTFTIQDADLRNNTCACP